MSILSRRRKYLAVVAVILWLSTIFQSLSAADKPKQKILELPVVPVRISTIVAKFQWTLGRDPETTNILSIAGSVMDGSDSLSIRQEAILPGIIWENDNHSVILGLQWLWPSFQSGDMEVHILQPGKAPIPYRFVGIDERIGLLLTEPDGTTNSVALKGLKTFYRKAPPTDTDALRMLCVPREKSFHLIALKPSQSIDKGRLIPVIKTSIPPLLLPFFTSGGDFDGFCYPATSTRAGIRELKTISRGDIQNRIGFLASNRTNLESGYLGVYLGDTRLRSGDTFVYIRGIVPDSPSEIAGLQIGDIIRTINGEHVSSMREMVSILRQFSPNSRIQLDLLRQGVAMKQKTILSRPRRQRQASIQMSLDILPKLLERNTGQYIIRPEMKKQMFPGRFPTTGIFLKTLSPRLLKAMGHTGESGALITYALPGYPGAKAGLRAGDLIVELSGQQIHSADDFTRSLKKFKTGQAISIHFQRHGRSHTVTMTLE